MNEIFDYIGLGLSALAIIVSFYATWIANSSNKKNQNIVWCTNKLKLLNLAKKTINDIPLTSDIGTIQFNRLLAIKSVLDSEVYFEKHSSTFTEIRLEFQDVYNDYYKVSGASLKNYSENLAVTCVLYDKNDFPFELSALYHKLKDIIYDEIYYFESSLKILYK